MRGIDAQRVEEADGIGGHVVEAIRRLRIAGQCGPHIRWACDIQVRGEARIAIVESDDMECPAGELGAEVVVPRDQLGTEARDEQDGRVNRIAGGFVLDVDTVGSRPWHEVQSYAHQELGTLSGRGQDAAHAG